MNPGDPRTLLDRHAARVLGRWREHLRALPPSSALAAPELLVPMMAPALARVRHEAARAASTGDTGSPVSLPAPQDPPSCRCGLNPLVAFYLTGETATFDILWTQPDALAPLPRAGREHICHVLSQSWRTVAAEEVALFCSVCQRGAALAAEEHRPATVFSALEPVGAGPARGKPWATARRSVGIPG